MGVGAVIGSLRVNLGMNSAEFSKDVKGVNKKLDRFQRQMAGVAKVAANAFAGIAVAAGAAFVGISQHADKMAKSAQKIGIPIEELSTLAHAAELSGVSFSNLETGIGRFSSNITDALSGLSTEGVLAFQSLDVSLKNLDGATKTTSELLGDIAERFQSMPDGAEKTAIAMRVFGKSGRDLIPMLNQGRDGIKSMTDEAARLGLQLSGETGKAAEAFNDNLTKVGQVMKGIAIQVVSNVLPAMRSLSERFFNAVNEGGAMQRVVTILTGVFNGLIRVVVFVSENLGGLYKIFKIFVAAQIVSAITGITGSFIVMAKSIRAAGLVLGIFTLVQRSGIKGLVYIAGAVALATGNFDKMSAALGGLWDKLSGLLPADFGDNIGAMFGEISLSTDGAADSFDTYYKASQQAAASFKPLTAASKKLGKSIGSIWPESITAANGLRRLSTVASGSMGQMSQTLQGTFGGWLDSAIDGTFRFSDAIVSLGNQIAKTFANRAIQQIWSSLFGSGGGFGGFSLTSNAAPIQYAAPQFALGGYTGNGAASAVAGIVHGKEFVVNASATRANRGVLEAMNSGKGVSIAGGGGGGSLKMEIVHVHDKNGNLESFVRKVSGQVAGQAISVAAPAIVEQSVESVGGSFGGGRFDEGMAAYGATRSARAR